MSESNMLLEGISSKLDVMIAILRLSNKEKIQAYSEQFKKDPICSKILDITLDPVGYGDLSKAVAEATGAAEITVKRKLAELRDIGAVMVRKKGREALYENTGLLD